MAVNTLTGPRVSRLPCLFTVWMVVRFVCVIRVPMCARVSRDLTQRGTMLTVYEYRERFFLSFC
jgi:hypothetical protein